jgi:MiaB/RimO family radical SAM methylthiotransferase
MLSPGGRLNSGVHEKDGTVQLQKTVRGRIRYHSSVASYYVENFGCRATQADGAAIERQFEERGVARASTAAHADLVVLNSCTVTSAADSDARAAIRRVQRQNPNAKIVVTGCYAQRAPEEIAALPGVTCVIGNSHKYQLAEIALRGRPDADAREGCSISSLDLATGTDAGGHLEFRAVSGTAKDDLEFRASGTAKNDFAWRSDSSAAKNAALLEGALAPEGSTFIPLATLTAGGRSPIFVSDIFAHTELLAAPVFDAAGSHENDRTRPNLKVQDGCDNRCSFCVIPYVRGQSRSLALEEIVREVNTLVEAGYREVVISGINLGRWGRDLAASRLQSPDLGLQTSVLGNGLAAEVRWPRSDAAPPHFEDLIRAILSETSLEKLRISSVEPMDWSDKLIALVAESPRIAKHAHVPLQSGSDAVLRRMHRKYRPWHYRQKIEKIRAAMPSAAIGADVMAGFPGETDAEFEVTRRLIEDLPFTYLHVFTYSARPGTLAANMRDQVPVHVARERNRILRELGVEKKQAFMRSFIGKTVEAITLSSTYSLSSRAESVDFLANQSGAVEGPASETIFTEALTDNYVKLHLTGRHQPNRWVRARVENVVGEILAGCVH